MRKQKLYKVLADGRVGHFSCWQWPPVGRWAPLIQDIRICRRGYHLTRREFLPCWVEAGGHVYEAEFDEEYDVLGDGYGDKLVGSRARLTRYLGVLTERMWSSASERDFIKGGRYLVRALQEQRRRRMKKGKEKG